MPAQKGRDLLLKIGDGADPETFLTVGAARVTAMALDNRPVDATGMDAGGVQSLRADAGVQSMSLSLDGIFRDAAAEELLRACAFSRALCNAQLCFPNGDVYAAAFAVSAYRRSGNVEDMEQFSVTLARSGAGTFTPGA